MCRLGAATALAQVAEPLTKPSQATKYPCAHTSAFQTHDRDVPCRTGWARQRRWGRWRSLWGGRQTWPTPTCWRCELTYHTLVHFSPSRTYLFRNKERAPGPSGSPPAEGARLRRAWSETNCIVRLRVPSEPRSTRTCCIGAVQTE